MGVKKSLSIFLLAASFFIILTIQPTESKPQTKRPGVYDRGYGAKCKTAHDCDMEGGLVCHDKTKTCVCVYSITKWNKETMTCEPIKGGGEGGGGGDDKPTAKPTKRPKPSKSTEKPEKPAQITTQSPTNSSEQVTTVTTPGDRFHSGEETTKDAGKEGEETTTANSHIEDETTESFSGQCCACNGRKVKTH